MSSYEDTGTKIMFITHFGRQQMNREINYISIFYEIYIIKILSTIIPTIKLIFSLHVAPKTQYAN